MRTNSPIRVQCSRAGAIKILRGRDQNLLAWILVWDKAYDEIHRRINTPRFRPGDDEISMHLDRKFHAAMAVAAWRCPKTWRRAGKTP